MTKKIRTYAISGALVASLACSPGVALALGGSGIPSDVARDGTVEQIGSNMVAEMANVGSDIVLGVGQLTSNLKEQLAAHSNMNQLMDERQRQREIEKVTFEAARNSGVTELKCKITTRAIRDSVSNRPTERRRQQTLATLEQLASWNLGTPVGSAGQPRTYSSVTEKAEMENAMQSQKDPQKYGMVAGSSIFSSINYATPEQVSGCESLVMNTVGLGGEGLANTSSIETVDSAVSQRNIATSQSRRSLTEKVMMDYCVDRTPQSVAEDSIVGDMLKSAENIAGYSTAELQEVGVSPAMVNQIRSQEWLSEIDPEGDQYTEVHLLDRVAMTLGWMARQNNEMAQKVDQLNVLQAATLAAVNESVSIERQQLEALQN